MKNRPAKLVALTLVFLFLFPVHLVAMAQDPTPAQDKPKTESEEAKKLKKTEEDKIKKEEELKRKAEKVRTNDARKYQTLTDFAEELYASDRDFHAQVDDAYQDLQSRQAAEAYLINVSRRQEVLVTETEGEELKIRRALYDNPRVQEYVNRLGQQIVPEDSDKLYAFKVTVNPIPQAYTLSTGTILVSTGMISLLDNEAQLAYVLAHELGHVYKDHWRTKVMLPMAEEEYNKKQENKRKMWAGIIAAAGAGVGAAIGGKDGIIPGAVSGLIAGYAISSYYAKRSSLDWQPTQENEADDFALRATLGKSFDVQEVPRLYATMAQVARSDQRTELGFLGASARIKERTDYARQVIDGSLKAQYDEALKANKIKGTSPEFNSIMCDLKRDNGIEAFYFDMFQMAKRNLSQSAMLRSDDPLTAYYYGRVMKQVGRTSEELEVAQQWLQKAIKLDVRGDIPEVQLHRALLLMEAKDASHNTDAVAALKNYITAYGRKRATKISNADINPPNLDVLYGYMRLLGDQTWTAPNIIDILRASALIPGGPTGQPSSLSLPRIEPAAELLSPVKAKNPQKQ